MEQSQLWSFFERIQDTHTGVCNICDTAISYKSTIFNLKMHLRRRHTQIYNNFFLTSPMPNNEDDSDKSGGENALSDNGSDAIKILITSNSGIWDVYKRVHGTQTALCFICNKYISYETSIKNLKDHLQLNHTDVHDLITKIPWSPSDVKESRTFKGNLIWNYFAQDDETATCNDCQRVFSYKNTISHLKIHLKLVHRTLYKKFMKQFETYKSDDNLEQITHSENSNLGRDLSHSQNNFIKNGRDKRQLKSFICDYFQLYPFARIAICCQCKVRLSYKSSTCNLRRHLKKKHLKAYKEILYKEQSKFSQDTQVLHNQRTEKSAKFNYNNRDIMVKGSVGETYEGVNILDHSVDSLHMKIRDKKEISMLQYGSNDESSDCEQSSSALKDKTHEEICQGENSTQLNTLNKSQDKVEIDTIWKYYDSNHETKIAQCNLCYRNLSYKTTFRVLKHHLRVQHKQVYNDYVSLSRHQSKNVHTKFVTAGKQTNESYINDDHYIETFSFNKNENEQTNLERDPFDSCITTSADTVKQLQRKNQNTLPPEVKIVADWHLLKIITEDFQLFNIVEDRGFREFVAVLNPHYELPDCNMLSTTLLPEEYNNRVAKYENITQICSSCTLTLECWTSKFQQSFIAVTGHFINKGTFQFHSVLLKCVTLQSQYTPDTIASELGHIMSSWGILNKVKLIVSEGVFDIAAVSRLLNLPYFECYVSKFNLVIVKAINDFSISSIVRKVQQTVEYFETNIEAKQKLFDYQVINLGIDRPTNLVLSIPRNWYSVYEMLKIFCDLQEALSSTIPNITDKIPTITLNEWQCINEIVEVLKPFDQAITLMSDEGYLQASKAVVLTAGLHIECTNFLERNFCDPVKRIISKLKEGLSTKFSDLEENKEIAICTLLDPRFQQHGFKDQAAMLNAKQYLLEKYEEISCNKDSENTFTTSSSTEQLKPLSLWDQFYTKVASSYPDGRYKTVKELNMYFSEIVIPQTECPLKWWKERQTSYPVLSKIFINSFNTVVTSLRCDRVFSKSSYVLMDRRKLLSEPEVEQIMFLHENK